jgi:hypothetical protein
MTAGALLELFIPTRLEGYQKDEAGKLGPFGGQFWVAAPIRQRSKDSSQELRYGTDQQLQHCEIFAKSDA